MVLVSIGVCRSTDLSVAPCSGEEHDACDMIRLHKKTMCEDAMKFGGTLASIRAPNQQELKIRERVAAYNAGDVNKVARID